MFKPNYRNYYKYIFRSCLIAKSSKMKFGAIVFLLSVFVSAQTVIGHRAKSRCQRNNMILQRRASSLFHKNKELMCMIKKAKTKGS